VTSDRLETVVRVFRPAQLVVIQSLLLQAGIFVCPTGFHHLTNQWPLALALGGIEVRVPEVQADDARALLESLPPLWMPAYEISRSGSSGCWRCWSFTASPAFLHPCFQPKSCLRGASAPGEVIEIFKARR
jgi:hypothetical protein